MNNSSAGRASFESPDAVRRAQAHEPAGKRSPRHSMRLRNVYDNVVDLLARDSATRSRLEGWHRCHSTARTLSREAATMYANGIESLIKETVTVKVVTREGVPAFSCHVGDAETSRQECFHAWWTVSADTPAQRAAMKKALGAADVAIRNAFSTGLRELERAGAFRHSTVLIFHPESRSNAVS